MISVSSGASLSIAFVSAIGLASSVGFAFSSVNPTIGSSLLPISGFSIVWPVSDFISACGGLDSAVASAADWPISALSLFIFMLRPIFSNVSRLTGTMSLE